MAHKATAAFSSRNLRKDFEDAIEHTDDYNDFMDKLQKFHDKMGTQLIREPVLGGKKLDVYRIYKWVQEAGGYDKVSTIFKQTSFVRNFYRILLEKVTSDRGWKKISVPFNLPPTCTNSAFVMKQVYMRNLHNYDLVEVQGKAPVTVESDGEENGSVEGSPRRDKEVSSLNKELPSSKTNSVIDDDISIDNEGNLDGEILVGNNDIPVVSQEPEENTYYAPQRDISWRPNPDESGNDGKIFPKTIFLAQ
ncbi:hypothetical protein HK096_007429 [Nowakowskiella sp. JEL0078]|nr:hypothetical protein HK096_007429 [Nowakowskiella sp. JEL0078]